MHTVGKELCCNGQLQPFIAENYILIAWHLPAPSFYKLGGKILPVELFDWFKCHLVHVNMMDRNVQPLCLAQVGMTTKLPSIAC